MYHFRAAKKTGMDFFSVSFRVGGSPYIVHYPNAKKKAQLNNTFFFLYLTLNIKKNSMYHPCSKLTILILLSNFDTFDTEFLEPLSTKPLYLYIRDESHITCNL